MIEVLIVDDHPIFRSGVSRLLSDEPDLRVTGEAKNGREAIDLLRSHRYQAILLDINMEGRSGLEVLERIRGEWPNQAVLMLSMYPEEQFATQALRAGAYGYLSKDTDAPELVRAIRTVASGGRYISPNALGGIFLNIQDVGNQPPHQQLSAREMQIMLLIVQGISLTEIGERMFLSVKTISTYRTRILAKLGLESNANLVRYALLHGLS